METTNAIFSNLLSESGIFFVENLKEYTLLNDVDSKGFSGPIAK